MKKPTKEVNRWTYAICAFTLMATSSTAVFRYMDTVQTRELETRIKSATLKSVQCEVGRAHQSTDWKRYLAMAQGIPMFQKQVHHYQDAAGTFTKTTVDFVSQATSNKSIENGCAKL